MITVQAKYGPGVLFTLQTSSGVYRLEGLDTGGRGVAAFQMLLPQETQVQVAWVPHNVDEGIIVDVADAGNTLCKFQIDGQDVSNRLAVSTVPGTSVEPSVQVHSSSDVVSAGTVLTWYGFPQPVR